MTNLDFILWEMNKFKTFLRLHNFQITICKTNSEIKPKTKASAMLECLIENLDANSIQFSHLNYKSIPEF